MYYNICVSKIHHCHFHRHAGLELAASNSRPESLAQFLPFRANCKQLNLKRSFTIKINNLFTNAGSREGEGSLGGLEVARVAKRVPGVRACWGSALSLGQGAEQAGLFDATQGGYLMTCLVSSHLVNVSMYAE